MRYAICFTPPIHDPLSIVAAEWLGRNVYSDALCEQLTVAGLTRQDMAFHTAVPRRYGFHATIKAPFRLADGTSEAMLLKTLMQFAGSFQPFDIPDMEVGWLGSSFGIAPRIPSEPMAHLAASVIQTLDVFRAPLSEMEIERLDPDQLTAPQFANLHRWGSPYVMDEFRFHLMLTGPMGGEIKARMEAPLKACFEPLLHHALKVASLALFIEPEPGAPLRVHSQHPLGKLSAHRPPQAGGTAATVAAAAAGSLRQHAARALPPEKTSA